MTIIQGIILGIIQGLTEFLPVSSSGHLVIGSQLLNTDLEGDPGFVIIVHFGTLLAVLIFFRQRLYQIFSEIAKGDEHGLRWGAWLIIGTIPAGVVGLLWETKIEMLFNSSIAVGIAWLGTALMLWAGEKYSRSIVSADGMGFWRALAIGMAQALALLPGISRSGSTISMGLLVGVKRKDLIDYIFILSIPPIAGATLLKSFQWFGGSDPFTAAHVWGGIASGISGYLAIAIMLKVVNAGKLGWFALYCGVAGIVTLIVTLF